MLSPQMLHKLVPARIPLALTFATSWDMTEMAAMNLVMSGVHVAGEVCSAGECSGAGRVWAGCFGGGWSVGWVKGMLLWVGQSLLNRVGHHGFG